MGSVPDKNQLIYYMMKTNFKYFMIVLGLGLLSMSSCEKNQDISDDHISSHHHSHCVLPPDTVVKDDCYDPTLIDSNVPLPCFIYEPVCGCDGVTYSSEQDAKYRHGIKNFTKGPCHENNDGCYDKSLINYDAAIIAIYAPVCGCDGVTYSSAAEAQVYHGVKKYTEGPCHYYIPDTLDNDSVITILPYEIE